MRTTYHLLYVGRQAQDPLLTAVQHMATRLRHYVDFCEHAVRETGDCLQQTQALHRSLLQLQRQAPTAPTILLDEQGHSMSSLAFAKQLQAWEERGKRHCIFVIGGADGLPPSLQALAQQRLSLSPFTLPHRLARLLLIEQLYRAHTIRHRTAYHH